MFQELFYCFRRGRDLSKGLGSVFIGQGMWLWATQWLGAVDDCKGFRGNELLMSGIGSFRYWYEVQCLC